MLASVYFSLQASRYFSAVIPQYTCTTITKEEWAKITNSEGQLLDSWVDIVCSKLTEVNPYCCYAIQWRWLKKNNSRKNSNVLFKAQGYCKFSSCFSQFHLAVSPHLKMSIKLEGSLIHRLGETQARPIRKNRRQELQMVLKYQSPSQ